ncbi:protein-cysteine N-palmitoyltransferase Rasp [Maniola jurtina]|uniref:protein-cysteine N-palmitoyltransferase Rasp n=1 Tax=Maniola jurtina TaxID=191418 RepID=UPI001E689974|nr:protein-cysteine N-palmitoyltransferase Rasp [Maniola jurtina]
MKLKSLELYTYFIIWISANIYSLYKLFEAQSDILRNNQDIHTLTDLQDGWRFTGRFKDVSDIEWSSWKYFLQTSWVYLIFQYIVSEFLRNTFSSILKYWYIVSSVVFVTIFMGYKQMIIIFTQPVIYAMILFIGGKKLSIWITSILLLFSYNSLKYKYYFWSFLDYKDMQDEEVYLILFSVAWIELRCISYCLDFVERKDGKSLKLDEIINMFSYILYLPLLYMGPIILYEEFENSFVTRRENLPSRIRRFICDMFFFQLYSLILDYVFHYIYFFAMQSNMELIRKLPTIALCGGGLFMGLEFHMKYVISYGTAGAFARLDNMDPPPTPRCIARIHVYSQMWRHFDVGLYRFLVKYIYKPSYSVLSQYCNLPRFAYKLIASLATFLFIFVWHGTVWHILIWSVLNYSGITLEHIGKCISRQKIYINFKKNILKSDAAETRFIAILCTPLLALSAISNFYLFAGSEVGNLFFECLSHPSLLSSCILGVSLYSCCQVSMALEHIPSRGSSKKDLGFRNVST